MTVCLGALAIHTAALYLPLTQFALDLEPIGLGAWLEIVAISLTVIVAVEIHKQLRRPADRSAPLSHRTAQDDEDDAGDSTSP